MRDSQMLLRSTTANLTSTETSAAFTMGPTPLDGLNCVVVVPQQGTQTTFDLTLQDSTDNSHWNTFLTFETLASNTQAVSTPVMQARRFQTLGQYIRSVVTVAGTSPNYGAVEVWLDDGPGFNFLGWQTPFGTSTDTRGATI